MRTLLAVGALAGLMAVSGCTASSSNYPIVVANRMPNAITVLANGNSIGEVGIGQVGSFSVRLQDTGWVSKNLQGNPVSPAPVSQVTVSARDQVTGNLSKGKSLNVTQFGPTYVEFAPTDF